MTRSTLSKPQSDLETRTADQSQSDGILLEEVVRDFLADYRSRDVTEQTVYRYRRYLGDHLQWLKREGLPRSTDQLQGQRGYRLLKQYLAYLRNERGLAHGTVATAYRILRTFWNWAARESQDEAGAPNNPPFVGRAPTSLFTRADVPRDLVADDVGEPYTAAEIERLLATIGPAKSQLLEVVRNRAMILTLWTSGLRRKELVNLLVSDYNADTGVIFVRRSAAKQTRRADDSRLTTLHGQAWREVNTYVRRLRAAGMANGPLFPSLKGGQAEHRGKHLRADSVTQLIDRLVKQTQARCSQREKHKGDGGCSECIRIGGVHRFRNSWTINQLQKGVSPSSVKTAGGWSSYEMLDRYSRKAASTLAIEEIRRVNGG